MASNHLIAEDTIKPKKSCPACTFESEFDAPVCVCGQSLPDDNLSKWICGNCTLHNKGDLHFCILLFTLGQIETYLQDSSTVNKGAGLDIKFRVKSCKGLSWC